MHGIVTQEVENGADVTDTELPNVPKLHERTAHPIINDLEPCFAKAKAEPDLNVTKVTTEACDSDYAKLPVFLWILARKELSRVNQSVSSWARWLSVTSNNQEFCQIEHRDSTDAYMAPVLFPIMENATVQHVLEKYINRQYRVLVRSTL